MLQKKYRLNKSKDIQKTSMRGRSFFSPNFVIKFQTAVSSTATTPRIGLIVSNKVSKKAVERNRMRRVIREALRLNIANIKLGDYVVIVRVKARALSGPELSADLLKSFRSTKLLQ